MGIKTNEYAVTQLTFRSKNSNNVATTHGPFGQTGSVSVETEGYILSIFICHNGSTYMALNVLQRIIVIGNRILHHMQPFYSKIAVFKIHNHLSPKKLCNVWQILFLLQSGIIFDFNAFDTSIS